MAQPIRVSNPSAQRSSPDISDLLPSIMSKNPLLEKSLGSHQHKGPWQPSRVNKASPRLTEAVMAPRVSITHTRETLHNADPHMGSGQILGTPLCSKRSSGCFPWPQPQTQGQHWFESTARCARTERVSWLSQRYSRHPI